MLVLSQFLLRLSFGLAIGMAVTNPRQITSGFYRTHLWVVLGLCTLALLVAFATPGFPVWPPLAGAILSYVGSILWIYEAKLAGWIALLLVAAVTLTGCWLLPAAGSNPSVVETSAESEAAASTSGTDANDTDMNENRLADPGSNRMAEICNWLDAPLAGLLLGFTITAMFLGHWYLNTPTMQIVPLQKLLLWMAGAIVLRAALSGFGLIAEATTTDFFTAAGAGTNMLLVTLRWLWGILGVAALTWMTWQTLKIPNTQSATGILYVAVIGVFLGELTAQLLSARLVFPV